jgi:hypothetical protein
MFDAPYSGGFAPGGRIFAVDGDFTLFGPDGPPEISFPIADSIVSTADVVLRVKDDNSPSFFNYQTFSVGNRSNYQPWAPSQQTFVIDQRFKVASEYYTPLPLNTRYNPDWALPWQGRLSNGLGLPGLAAAILVHSGEIKNCGGGIAEIELRFATIPPTWNEAEQYCLKRLGFNDAGNLLQTRDPIIVMSRVQYDYFVFDKADVIPDVPLFTDLTAVGIRLNGATGFRPPGIILPAMRVWGPNSGGDAQEIDYVTDAIGAAPASIPSLTQYESWMENGNGTSNGLPAEMVVEASTFSRWMGNIMERRTRFAEVQ